MPEPKILKTIFTYPWDLSDEGVERALDVIQDTANLNGVSLAVSYHIGTYFLPHNSKRKIYFGEDGMALFQPTQKLWDELPLKPRVSQVVEDKDWLPKITERIKKRGLHLTAWTVFFYNHYLARNNPEFAKRDALGNPNLAQLCPANPVVRSFALALTDDIASQCKPDAFYLESLHYLPFSYGFLNPKVLTPITPKAEYLLGLCFCEHCVKGASKGLDTGKFKKDVAEWLYEDLYKMPTEASMAAADQEWKDTAFESRLQHYLAARTELATSLYEAVAKKISSYGDIKVETEYATQGGVSKSGLIPARVHKVTDRIGLGVPTKEDEVKPRREELPVGKKLLANIQPAHLTSEEAITKTVDAARAAGVDGFTFYNYGLIRMEQLRWIGAACKDLE